MGNTYLHVSSVPSMHVTLVIHLTAGVIFVSYIYVVRALCVCCWYVSPYIIINFYCVTVINVLECLAAREKPM